MAHIFGSREYRCRDGGTFAYRTDARGRAEGGERLEVLHHQASQIFGWHREGLYRRVHQRLKWRTHVGRRVGCGRAAHSHSSIPILLDGRLRDVCSTQKKSTERCSSCFHSLVVTQLHSACHFASLQAAGAHSDPFHRAVVVHLHGLKVWEPAALVEDVRVTHLISSHRPFSTDFTASCHIVAPPCTLADYAPIATQSPTVTPRGAFA